MKDYVIKVLSKGMGIRGIAGITTGVSQYAASLHRTSPLSSIILAHGLTAGALMGGLIKQQERVGLKFEGNGPVQKMVIEAEGHGCIRGYLGNPQAEMDIKPGDHALAGAFGRAGLLTVIKDLGLKQPYISTVHLATGMVGKDLSYYFTESEQIPSAVGVSANLNNQGLVSHCGGFLVQSMPAKGGKGASDANLESVIERIEHLSLREFLSQNNSPENIIDYIFSEVPYDILEITEIKFKCICSQEKFVAAIITLGKKEVKNLMQEGGAEIVCEYCKKKYLFDKKRVAELLEAIG